MDHTVPHTLGRDIAKKVTNAALTSYVKKFADNNPTMSWKSEFEAQFQCSVAGSTLEGIIEVRDSELAITVDVPFLLSPFKGKAIEVIDTEISEWIERAKKGDLGGK